MKIDSEIHHLVCAKIWSTAGRRQLISIDFSHVISNAVNFYLFVLKVLYHMHYALY